jgi:cytochrome oxidase assembly protein ShyY1
LVNRGWVPLGLDRAQLPEVPLPIGELTLQGRLDRPASVGIALGEVDYKLRGLSVLPYLNVSELGQAIGRDLPPMALVLDDGQPGALTADPIPLTQMGPEKHLGYAVQWFGLATALLMIYVGLNTRREK